MSSTSSPPILCRQHMALSAPFSPAQASLLRPQLALRRCRPMSDLNGKIDGFRLPDFPHTSQSIDWFSFKGDVKIVSGNYGTAKHSNTTKLWHSAAPAASFCIRRGLVTGSVWPLDHSVNPFPLILNTPLETIFMHGLVGNFLIIRTIMDHLWGV